MFRGEVEKQVEVGGTTSKEDPENIFPSETVLDQLIKQFQN